MAEIQRNQHSLRILVTQPKIAPHPGDHKRVNQRGENSLVNPAIKLTDMPIDNISEIKEKRARKVNREEKAAKSNDHQNQSPIHKDICFLSKLKSVSSIWIWTAKSIQKRSR